MKKEEARRAVLSEYDRWAKKHPNDARMMGGFLFFRYLQKERSDLLDFRMVGDKWQTDYCFRKSSGSFATFAAIRRACSIPNFFDTCAKV